MEKDSSASAGSQFSGCPRDRNPFKAPSKPKEASERRILQELRHEKVEKNREIEKEDGGEEWLDSTKDEKPKPDWRSKELPPGMRVKTKLTGEGRSEMDYRGAPATECTEDPVCVPALAKERAKGDKDSPIQEKQPQQTAALNSSTQEKEERAKHRGQLKKPQNCRDAKAHDGQEGKARKSGEGKARKSGQGRPLQGCSTDAEQNQDSEPARGKGLRAEQQEGAPHLSQGSPCPENDGEDDVLLVSVQPGRTRSPSAALVQTTLASFPGFQAVVRPKGQQDDPRAMQSQLSMQLKQKKAVLSTVNISALPDNGERLKNQVRQLEEALESLSLSVDTNGPSSPPGSQEADDGAKSRSVPSLPNPVSRQGSTILLPEPPVPVQATSSTLGLDLMQGCSQSYGVNPQSHTFYGGRMTENRLLAVRNATSEAIDHLHRSLESCPGENAEQQDPLGIKVSLLPHQRRALAWLLWRETQKPCGGILADDMGLGKTLTIIALILAKRKKEEGDKKVEEWVSKSDSSLVTSKGTLVVCPASLVHHWKKEMERHVKDGRLSVYLYHGPSRRKNARFLAEHDVVVTTYSLVSKEIPVGKEDAEKPSQDSVEESSDLPPLLRVAWARVVLDEAHNIKNPKVQTSIAVCKLRAQARWAVTGTPVQNNLLDMYSLLKFLRCSPFDEFKLWKAQVDNGSKRGRERLNILTRTLMLRRTKEDLDTEGKPLVSLPDRVCEVHRLKLSKDEQAVYDVIFAQSRSTLQSYLQRHEGSKSTEDCTTNPFQKVAHEFGVPANGATSSSAVHILSLLLRLRQCCCHLSLLKKTLSQTELQDDGIVLSLEQQMTALSLSDPSHGSDPKATVSLNGSSFPSEMFEETRQGTKISAVLSEIKKIRQMCDTQKCVVVSQWTSMLQIVAAHLRKLGLRFATIDGTVNPKRRMDLVEDFNTNPKGAQVMLVSLCAGGVGINLIGGNHLFLMDMHWNPALEDQACDRIYRVGQTRNVTIHRFVCEGTVEEKISSLQEKKKDLARKVLSGTSTSVTKLSLSDLKVIFGV